MPNGYATRQVRRRSAGTMRRYPKTCSCSHRSRARARRPGTWSPVTSSARGPTATLADLQLPLEGQGDLLLRPLHRALRRHAVDRLRHHVREDVIVVDALHSVARLRGPAARVRELRLPRQHRELRISRPDGMVGQVLERRVGKGVGGDGPGVEVLLAGEGLDGFLRQLDVLRELPDAKTQDGG